MTDVTRMGQIPEAGKWARPTENDTGVRHPFPSYIAPKLRVDTNAFEGGLFYRPSSTPLSSSGRSDSPSPIVHELNPFPSPLTAFGGRTSDWDSDQERRHIGRIISSSRLRTAPYQRSVSEFFSEPGQVYGASRISQDLPQSSRATEDSDCEMGTDEDKPAIRREVNHTRPTSVSQFNASLKNNNHGREIQIQTLTGHLISVKIIRNIGSGTFSAVFLAAALQQGLGNREQPVALKVIELTAVGGISRNRIERSLRREVDILQKISHPSIVQLLAFSNDDFGTILVLNYCAGGDLFDFSRYASIDIRPAIIQRIFAELCDSLLYLHEHNIVHRDVKLENVLLNIGRDNIQKIGRPELYPLPLTTLADLGLSRLFDPQSPLLTTRCGSEDYAAPELLMGEKYDGRQTDAWALGVLLYALLERRLPFDAPVGMTAKNFRSRTIHRIVRCDWRWARLENIGGNHELTGGKEITEGLLCKKDKRMTVAQARCHPWTRQGLKVVIRQL